MEEVKMEPMTEPGVFFTAWLPQSESEARCRIVHSADSPAGLTWKTIERLTYSDMWLRSRHLFVVEQQIPGPIRE